MTYEVIGMVIVIVGGALLITAVLRLLFGNNIVFRSWGILLPGIALLVVTIYIWGRVGGVHDLMMTFIMVPIGMGLLIVDFIVFGRIFLRQFHRFEGVLVSSSDQVRTASEQITVSSQQLAEGSSEQAASIEETSSSLEELSSMTRQNAGHANQAKNLSDDTTKATDTCANIMQEMAASIGQVNEASRETQKIVKTIDEIAFQTNLLALNAAVEAARAGEAGAGFAVVAEEVRNLAMRSADAAKNTTEQINDITTKIGEAMEMSMNALDEFVKVAEDSGKVNSLVQEISAASDEQAQGIEQINQAVGQMDKVVQQNAANAEESASAAQQMKAQAQSMKEALEKMDIFFRGTKGGKASETPAASLKPKPFTKKYGEERRLVPDKKTRPRPSIQTASSVDPPRRRGGRIQGLLNGAGHASEKFETTVRILTSEKH
jgi:methyl-accepting chemotaxis protein